MAGHSSAVGLAALSTYHKDSPITVPVNTPQLHIILRLPEVTIIISSLAMSVITGKVSMLYFILRFEETIGTFVPTFGWFLPAFNVLQSELHLYFKCYKMKLYCITSFMELISFYCRRHFSLLTDHIFINEMHSGSAQHL